ncbi:MAG: polyisoprenyl-phosphate glycosyltransferase [Phycisphaerales bacterium]|nr:polyisoprenyl-phosphate glycosyltransferase [Phycisphaerales bacterium]MEA2734483.1 polyisoprenyl-phosphate glycosyltransferase [Humisphaera sp.]
MISVVVPIFNEQENLPELRRRLVAALEQAGEPWEIVLVNDGSRDKSAEIIRQFHIDDPRIKLIDLSRNFGHQPAVTAGVHNARGACVILIDGDLQDPPEVIPDMVKKWREGNQVVLGERSSRTDSGARGIGFRLFYPVLRALADLPSAPDAGIFGLMDRRVVDEFNKLPERNRFIPGLRSWLGFKQSSVTYDRTDRAAGKPKQTLRKLIHYAMDAIFSFSYRPLRWVTYMGVFVSTITFGLGLWYIFDFFYHRKPITGFTTTIVCVLFLGGVQMIAIGIVGEYIGRIYEEIKQRPLYIVREKLGVE